MHPGSNSDSAEDSRIVPLDGMVGLERTFKILGVEPSSYRQHCTFDALHVLRNVARLPILVGYRIVRLVIEEWVLDDRFKIRNGILLQEILVSIRCPILEITTGGDCRRQLEFLRTRLEIGVEIEIRGQHEGAAVVSVV